MLCQFGFSNYKSFRDEVILNMRSSVIKEHLDSLIEFDDGEKFLPVAAIYGPNGGGKSNVCEAFTCLMSHVAAPILALSGTSKKSDEYISALKTSCTPFAFDKNSKKEPTKFAVIIRIKSYEYAYELSILNNEICEESLVRTKIGGKKPALLFSRENSTIFNGRSLNRVNEIRISSTIPYLSFLAINYKLQAINDISMWFVKTYFINFEINLINNNLERSPGFTKLIEDLSAERMKLLLAILESMDIPISGIKIDNNSNKKIIKTYHTIDQDHIYHLTLDQESLGTQKIISFMPILIEALFNGFPLIIDELDSRLHPKLLEFIINLFKDRQLNKLGAQLIHTSHDVTTMRNDIYRRDEIWFTARDNEGVSQLYSLLEFRDEQGLIPRPDATFNKQYLSGRYGADPYLKAMMNWPGDKDESKTSET